MGLLKALRWAGLGVLIGCAIALAGITCMSMMGADKGVLKLAFVGTVGAVFVAGVSIAIAGAILNRRRTPPTNT